MADRTLYKLLQVSDLHFGDIPKGLSNNLNAPSPRLIGLSPLFDGQLGHHVKGVLSLHNFMARLRRSGEPFDMVMTGDVTANGGVDQFDLAGDYLGSGPSAFGYCLGQPNWAQDGIPGNHDQWNGNNLMVGGPTPGLARHLARRLPAQRARILPDGTILRFIFIDTDADVRPYSQKRILGRGAFQTQLQELESLPAIEDHEIRVLVMHHSIVGPARTKPHPKLPYPAVQVARGIRRFRSLEITSASRRMLDHFIVDHSISVVLSGHMHVALLSEMEASNGAYTRGFLEARCGSTTQRDTFEYKDRRGMSRGRALRPNTLLMHEIVREGGDLVWKTDVHWLSPNRRFGTNPPTGSPAPNTAPQARFVLR
ncbi:metallophosphoesterase [Methylobacterium sp. 285MFTsu5.1]|uniref:metallophosphoesterase family protein n=1 Tax=Methylobacterium sp. 285MFTsu5.1 TaxID=1172187 RepID=UPI00131A08DF|nr:metallophosphoesterase [Methylobacterium sp. 285MFTsu5.1]